MSRCSLEMKKKMGCWEGVVSFSYFYFSCFWFSFFFFSRQFFVRHAFCLVQKMLHTETYILSNEVMFYEVRKRKAWQHYYIIDDYIISVLCITTPSVKFEVFALFLVKVMKNLKNMVLWIFSKDWEDWKLKCAVWFTEEKKTGWLLNKTWFGHNL